MNDIEILFYDLLRVAIGAQEGLTRVPTEREWGKLYKIAEKQSLVGICFAGVQKLCDSDAEDYCGMSEMQYLMWMGMAAKIQQRNHIVDGQCVELCQLLKKNGFRSCVLKGQGTANLYGDLAALRQSGDIDVWVMPQDVRTIKESRPRITEFVHGMFPKEEGAFVHIGFSVFKDTEVEMHYIPTIDGNPIVDRKFERLFEKYQDECFENVCDLGFAVPEALVNILFNLHHIKKHFLTSGIGLRHIMDLYFIIEKSRLSRDEELKVKMMMKKLGMLNFFKGVLWVMQEVLGVIPVTFDIVPNERLGRFILQEIMIGGNFGHHDERLKGVNEMTFVERWKHFLQVSKVRAQYFPLDVFWSFIMRLRVGIWRKTGIEI